MKTVQLRELTADELIRHKTELEEEMFNLRLQKAIKQLTNPKRLGLIRHEIAKVNTLLTEQGQAPA